MVKTDFNKVFSANLKELLRENDVTQAELALKLNVSATSVSNWCKGEKAPRMDKVDAICKLFNCRRSDLMEEHTRPLGPHQVTAIRIPVLGHVAAGIPISAITDIVDWEELPSTMVREGDEYFALKIKGDSMEPRIKDGDVVIVRQQDYAEDGDTIIALVNGDDAVCKRLKRIRDGIALISSNPSYDPMYFTEAEIDNIPVKILGKVKELRANL